MCFKFQNEAIVLMRAGAKLYHENTQGRKAAEELGKAAGWVRDDNTDLAYQLYTEACDIYEVDGQTHMALDLYRTAIAFLVRENRLSDATALLMKQNNGLVKHMDKFAEAFNKNCLNICILHLSCRETQLAENVLSSFQRYLTELLL